MSRLRGHEDRGDRDVAGPLRGDVRDRAGHVVGSGDERRDEDRHDRVDGRIVREDAEGAGEVVRGGAGDQVDRVGDGRLGRGEGAQSGLGVGGERRGVEPVAGARVGGEDARPAGVGEDRDGRPAGKRLAGEQRGDVEELAEGVGADDAGLAEERIDRHVGRGEQRAGVGARGPGTRGRSSRLDGQDRLLRRDARRDPGEAAGVPERLEVEQDDVGGRVVLPVPEEVVAGEVGLVAHRDERREAEAELTGALDHGDPDAAALRHDADGAGRWRGRGERRVQPRDGAQDPKAVRADEAHARRAAHLEQIVLALRALTAELGEAGGDDDERAAALPAHSRATSTTAAAGTAMTARSTGPSTSSTRPMERVAGHRAAAAVDEVQVAGEPAGEKVARDRRADRAGTVRRADERDRRGLEHAGHRGRRGDMIAVLEARPRLRRERRRQLDREPPRLAWTDTGKPLSRNTSQHPVVLRQDERRERVDVAGARGGREVAEQDRRHASALQLVGDGERHLRASPTHVDRHRMGDDPLLLTDGRHEAEAVDVVDVGRPRRGLLEVAAAGEEAKPARLGRKRLQEAEEAVAVRGADGANPDRGAVAQDDVGLELSGIRRR